MKIPKLTLGGTETGLAVDDSWITVRICSREELKRLEALKDGIENGIISFEHVAAGVYKVQVKPESREKVINELSSSKMGLRGGCYHALNVDRDKTTRYYQADEIAIRFSENLSHRKIQNILRRYRLRLLRQYPDGRNIFLVQVTRDSKNLLPKFKHDVVEPFTIAEELASLPEVKYATPDLIERVKSFHKPKDRLFDQQWHLHSEKGPDLVPMASISAVKAWDITRGTRDITVAVLDDGFDLSHPDFNNEGKIVHPQDFVDGDSNPFPEGKDDDYHGTPCAGLAIAEENGQGVVGVAPGCSFMPVRIPFKACLDQMWEIFDYAGTYADVISCSWGPPPVHKPLSPLIYDKITLISESGGPRGKGCVIVFAAGNYNAPLRNDDNGKGYEWMDHEGNHNVSFKIWNGFPTHPDVIAVSSCTSLNKKALYGSWGKEISVCAPSNNRHPLDRFAYLPGRGVWTTDNERFGSGVTGGSRFTGHFGGTSSSAPIVAGVAALVLSANKNLTASEVRQILQETADKIEDHEADPMHGHNKGTYKNGHSEWFGYGKVNAQRAVERAVEMSIRQKRPTRSRS